MSWLIVGTVPSENFPLTEGTCVLEKDGLRVGEERIKIARGTPALIAAACATADVLSIERPCALLVGDTGKGEGSRQLYDCLADTADKRSEIGYSFHYLFPDVFWHNKILWKIESLSLKPMLVADAGYMYAAKMSGFASSYTLFTPDVGEMAFLADSQAPHPFYTRGFLLQDENQVPDLIQQAYTDGNAAQYLLVKGQQDYVACEGEIIGTVSEPCVASMEPIGGTGDTLTGIVTAFLMDGYSVSDACMLSARANRLTGFFANPSPAFSIQELLPFLYRAVESVLNEKCKNRA